MSKKIYEDFTPEEFIEDHLNELVEDAIGLWQLTNDKLLFDFTEEELEIYLYKAIKRLIEVGAKPVFGSGGEYIWVVQTQYGTRPEEIAKNIIEDWKKRTGTTNPLDDFGGIWFATENVYSEKDNGQQSGDYKRHDRRSIGWECDH